MENTTYSFIDTVGSISHPSIGAYILDGTGIGSLTISKATDRTAHDIAADGSVMISKVAGNNGTITIEIQQTTALHRWLMSAFSQVWGLETSEWAGFSIVVRNAATQTSHYCKGVSFQKEADTPYQSQGQRVTWTFMCAEITNMAV